MLERDPVLGAMSRVFGSAAGGAGAAVLVTGDAGIGKSTVVRSFLASIRGQARVLAGACDDLVTPYALGPLREAAAGTSGPLAEALAAGPAGEVFGGLVAELSGPRPTVLLVEDLHWADHATLDALAYLAGRLPGLPAVLLLTCCDGEAAVNVAVQRFLGTLARTSTHRLALEPLSAGAVDRLATAAGRDGAALFRLTGGNPFFVTEVLAATPGAAVPASVTDAVLARTRVLAPPCRVAVEQLSVVPSTVGFGLAQALLGDRLDVLAEAEERGILAVLDAGLAFRHELARRAVEQSLPLLVRRSLHERVLGALRDAPEQNLARLVHHATEANDAAALAEFAPEAGREAAAAGAHREARAYLATALRHEDRLPPSEVARVVDDHAWELYNAREFGAALAGGERAVALYRRLGEATKLGESLVRLSRHRYMAGDTAGALAAAEEALGVLDALGDPAAVAYAATYLGAVLALSDEPAGAAAQTLARARAPAVQTGRHDLVALCLNYLSLARPGLADDERLALLEDSVSLALQRSCHEAAARGYTNLAELQYRLGRFDALERTLADGLAFTAERGFWSHAFNLRVHRCLLWIRRGDWASGCDGLREAAGEPVDPGMLAVYARPAYARMLARRGSADAWPLLRDAWQAALRQRLLLGLAFAGAALAEWGWLNDRPDVVREVLKAWRPHAARPTAAPAWAEILRYAARAGVQPRPEDMAALPGPADPAGWRYPWEAGLRGDWRAAAAGWARAGDPYERALELADSGEPGPMVEAVLVLERLEASIPKDRLRASLRKLGITRVPRGPRTATRANPAGLTKRQQEVLDLLASGLTNAAIADRLVVSVRTVDAHVAAILAKLGVRTRQQAADAARSQDHADAG